MPEIPIISVSRILIIFAAERLPPKGDFIKTIAALVARLRLGPFFPILWIKSTVNEVLHSRSNIRRFCG
jgi:hypothetical protein